MELVDKTEKSLERLEELKINSQEAATDLVNHIKRYIQEVRDQDLQIKQLEKGIEDYVQAYL